MKELNLLILNVAISLAIGGLVVCALDLISNFIK